MFRNLTISLMVIFVLASLSIAQDDEPATFSLQILHSSDNESSFQDPNTLEPKILHYATLVEGLRQLAPDGNSIHLTVGDHTLDSPFYDAAADVDALGAPGLADIAIFNALDVTANGMGNHEFDGGINDFARMLASANYPFIAVNLDFSNVELEDGVPEIQIGEDASNIEDNVGKVVKSVWLEIGGERIGLIGRAPADFFNVIDNVEENLPGLDFIGGRSAEDNQPLISAVEQVNEQVDLLEAQGINKIILLDHAQDFTNDPLSTQFLRGIDLILSAGSTGFMARPDADGPFNLIREGDTPQADYPTVRLDSENNFVLIVNNDPLYTYVGHLIVAFDDDGTLLDIDGLSGPIATTEEAITLLEDYLDTDLDVPDSVQSIYDALLETELIQEQFEVIGSTDFPLNGERESIRSAETNFARLITDSTIWWANITHDEPVDVALKNGGGIRASILGPSITRLSINSALAFDNDMVIVELTASEMIATFENAVSRYPASDGRFPQVAGAYIEFDPSREGMSDQISMDTPSRLRTLIITRANGTQDVIVEDFTAQGDLDRTFLLVTNSFLLTGGDGYQSLLAANEARGSVNPGVGERQILIDYIRDVLRNTVDIPSELDDSRVLIVEALSD